MVKIIKSIAKLGKAKVKLSHKVAKTPTWFEEAKDIAQNPHKYKAYEGVDEMFEEILK